MIDYLARDNASGEHAIVPAGSPVDAVQEFINIYKRDNRTGYRPDPHDVTVYPITRKNAILQPQEIE